MNEHIKAVGDVAAGAVTVLTLTNVLPAVAAGLTIVWTAMRIYEGFSGKKFSESALAKFVRWDWS